MGNLEVGELRFVSEEIITQHPEKELWDYYFKNRTCIRWKRGLLDVLA